MKLSAADEVGTFDIMIKTRKKAIESSEEGTTVFIVYEPQFDVFV